MVLSLLHSANVNSKIVLQNRINTYKATTISTTTSIQNNIVLFMNIAMITNTNANNRTRYNEKNIEAKTCNDRREVNNDVAISFKRSSIHKYITTRNTSLARFKMYKPTIK